MPLSYPTDLLALIEGEVGGLGVGGRVELRVHDVREPSLADAERATEVQLGIDRVTALQSELDGADQTVAPLYKPAEEKKAMEVE